MAEKQNKGKRLDRNRLKLRKGESQRKNGSYDYRWTTPDGKRHTIYAATLDELREKEEAIISDKRDGIKVEVKRITVNDMFDCGVRSSAVLRIIPFKTMCTCTICLSVIPSGGNV